VATQLATVEQTSADPLRQAIEKMAPEFRMALPAHVTVDKFVRVTMTAINANADLRQADKRSLFASVTKLAQDGLLPDGREAALVIFNTKNKDGTWTKKVQAMPMIAGLLKLMRQSGEVAWVDAHVVCEHDRFVYRPGLDDVPVFEPDWFGDRGAPIGAYAIAKLKSGEIVPPEIMSIAAIEKVRAVSRSKDKGPWVDWWEQQALKTVLRRFLKRLPTSADVERAFDRDETMQAQFDGEPAAAVEHQPVARLPRLDALEHQIEGEETGEVIDQQAVEFEAEISEPEESELDARLHNFRLRIEDAATLKVVKAIDADWVKARAAYDDEAAAEIDGLISAKRRELGEGE
jgi:recombination protein RecT